MAIDGINIAFSYGEAKKALKTVKQAQLDKSGKKAPKVNEKQQKFRKTYR